MHGEGGDLPRQGRLAGLLPPPEVSRRVLLEAVSFERELEAQMEVHKEALKETRAALRAAQLRRRAAEDDLAAATAQGDSNAR